MPTITFFNRHAIDTSRDPNYITIGTLQAELSKTVSNTVVPVAAVLDSAKFKETSNAWFAHRIERQRELEHPASSGHNRKFIIHSAEADDFTVEVIDWEPMTTGDRHSDRDTYYVNRGIIIYPKDQPGRRETVSIGLTPTNAPTFGVNAEQTLKATAWLPERKVEGYSTYRFEDSQTAGALAAAKIIDIVEAAIPAPSWVQNFDRQFEIKDDRILANNYLQ